jgi:hypothetical protein
MNIKRYIPIAIKEQYRLLKNQKKFGSKVKTCFIHPTTILSKDVYIAPNVDLRANVKIDII